MEQAVAGVGEAMPETVSWPSRLLAVGAGVVLLADLPSVFTRGDVLRSVLFCFLGSAGVALGLLWPAARGRPGRLPSLLLWLPLVVVLAALPAAFQASGVSLLRTAAPWIGLAALALGLVRVWPNDDEIRRIWLALVFAGALAGVWVALDGILRQAPGAGPFGRPGIAGPVLAALLPAILFLPRLPVVPRLGLATGIAGGLIVSLSRTGFVAAVFGLLGAGLLAAPARWRGRLGWGLGAVVVLAGVALALAASGRQRIPGGGTTFEVRLGLWKASSTLVAERPLLGHGLGSFESEVLRVRDPHEAGLSRGRRPRVAHNDYLHVAAEGGIVAWLALVAFAGGVLGLALVLSTRAVPPGGERRLAVVAGGSFFALTVAALGEDVLLDPAGALVASVAAASVVALTPRGASRPGAATTSALALLGLVALVAAGVRSRDLLSNAHLRAYRDALPDFATRDAAVDSAHRHLETGALAWRSDAPEAWYRLGVHRADLGNFSAAREAWRRALAVDPGMTEAWLDIARSYEREDRPGDAEVALLEAQRRDPARYDVHVRLGHLALGPEPVPGEAWEDRGRAIPAHRHYNEAERLGPGRLETPVARARIARRLGRLDEAGRLLREANEIASMAPEIVLESFRLEEVERRMAELAAAGILGLALTGDPDLSGRVRREAERFLVLGVEREAAIRERAVRAAAAGNLTPADYAAADRAYSAAARRLAGLLHAGVIEAPAVLGAAVRDAEARRWRAALARYRALLSKATLEPPEQGIGRAEQLDALTELQLRAAKAATRVDGALARHYYDEGHETRDNAALAWEDVRDRLEREAAAKPKEASVRILLARARLRLGDADGAEAALVEALDLEPISGRLVREFADLGPLLQRPAVAERLDSEGSDAR